VKDRQSLGQRGEALAVQHLTQAGYTILDRNVRTRYGEIDVVARDGACTVFVEVRTVASGLMAPEESVTPRKQRRVAALGRAYLARHGLADTDWRADVVAITVTRDGRPPRITHIVNAIEE
jgi:putative endonuclease